MRADEHAWENFGQAYTITITGAVDTERPEGEGDRVEARRVDVDSRRPAGPTREHGLGDPDGLPRDAVQPQA